jgi:hypothetical protein
MGLDNCKCLQQSFTESYNPRRISDFHRLPVTVGSTACVTTAAIARILGSVANSIQVVWLLYTFSSAKIGLFRNMRYPYRNTVTIRRNPNPNRLDLDVVVNVV